MATIVAPEVKEAALAVDKRAIIEDMADKAPNAPAKRLTFMSESPVASICGCT